MVQLSLGRVALQSRPNDLERPEDKVIKGFCELLGKCIIVSGEDRLSVQANDNATILFQVRNNHNVLDQIRS